jgi:thiol:disulfide interchange protein DsbC
MKRFLILFLLVFLMTTQACAQQSSNSNVKEQKIVKNFLSSTNSTLLETKDLGSIYELVIQQGKKKGILYLTKDGKYLIVGSLIDENNKNLTQERFEEITKVEFSQLPLNEAIIIKKGSGTKKLIMITDVDCPFCKKAYSWLKEKSDYTLYVYLFPLPMHPNAYEKSVKVLCSDNKETALAQAKEDREIPVQKCSDGENMLKKHIALAESLGVTGTPLFITETGKKIPGFNQQVLEEYLKK